MALEPIQKDLHAQMNAAMRVLNDSFKPHGVVLLVFSGDSAEPRANYISNCSRDDMIAGLKEFIARSEGRVQDTDVVQ
jgi:hypothetical protein